MMADASKKKKSRSVRKPETGRFEKNP